MTTIGMRRPGRPARLWVSLGAAAGLAAAGLAWQAGTAPSEALAFDHSWTLVSCKDVESASQRGMYDDAPGAGNANDSAFLFLVADEQLNENCLWRSTLSPAVSMAIHGNLTVRAAANDNSRVWVWVRSTTDCSDSNSTVAEGHFWLEDGPLDSAFHTVTDEATTGTARSVCVMLDDRSNSHAQRISALIDRISLTSDDGAIGWEETFTRSG
jgi:hypothetical protein